MHKVSYDKRDLQITISKQKMKKIGNYCKLCNEIRNWDVSCGICCKICDCIIPQSRKRKNKWSNKTDHPKSARRLVEKESRPGCSTQDCVTRGARFAFPSPRRIRFPLFTPRRIITSYSTRVATHRRSLGQNATLGSAKSACSRNRPRRFRIRVAIPCAITRYERRRLCQ